MSAPLLTVIVPAYNSEDYLDRALTTLVGYGDELEAIIVNDGSKDRTTEIADEWAARYPSVKVIHQENKGTLANMLGINGTIHAAMALGMPEFRFSNYIDKKDTVETDL